MEVEKISTRSTGKVINCQSQGEYLTFRLGDEAYGLDILKVQEIRHYEVTTHIANTSNCIKGVVALRGQVVPIIDLRILLGLENANYDEFTVVIILNLTDKVVGIVVDGVSDVKNLSSHEIRTIPEIVSSSNTKYITGLAAIDNRMFILVDIEELLSVQELACLNCDALH